MNNKRGKCLCSTSPCSQSDFALSVGRYLMANFKGGREKGATLMGKINDK